ncbi:MAG: hypothetical protein BWX80_01818 [Candidatus Hydrogenedentes bacterium ADurb.Bin101]|nr:MAG: hypothetical protein BWX80_01818 [Candidatus Hydrogenedentes bacterium ADurb.Bin101]
MAMRAVSMVCETVSNAQLKASGLPRFNKRNPSFSWYFNSGGVFRGENNHSGCSRSSQVPVMARSGSNQTRKRMPLAAAAAPTGSSPRGNRVGSGCMFPWPRANPPSFQPASSQKVSSGSRVAAMSAARRHKFSSVVSLKPIIPWTLAATGIRSISG